MPDDPGATVRTTDLRDGSYEEAHLEHGNYVLVCGPGCHVAHEQRFANGTVVLTIKREPATASSPATNERTTA